MVLEVVGSTSTAILMTTNTASLHGGAMAAQDCSAQSDTATEFFIQMCDEDGKCEYSCRILKY